MLNIECGGVPIMFPDEFWPYKVPKKAYRVLPRGSFCCQFYAIKDIKTISICKKAISCTLSYVTNTFGYKEWKYKKIIRHIYIYTIHYTIM